jgi:tetratricopeptide (TPR) repeat protein
MPTFLRAAAHAVPAIAVVATATAGDDLIMTKRNILLLLALIVIVILLLGFFLYRYETGSRSASTTPSPTSAAQMNDQTAQNDPAFAAAQQLESQGNYASAIPQLQSALSSTSDPSQDVTIMFHLEQDYEFTGNYQAAAQTLQQIASSNTYSSLSHAFAVEQLGVLYSRFPTQSVASAVFDQAPYSALYVATSSNLTLRNIFGYATTIYPLPVSEYSLANSYANSILNQGLVGQTSAAAKTKLSVLEVQLLASFQAGNAAYKTVLTDPPAADYLLSAELEQAIVLGKLQQIGNTSEGDAGQAFQSLLSSYSSQNDTADGVVRLQYASFLANTGGTSNASDIASLLSPVIQDPTHRGVFVEPLLKAYVGAASSRTKQSLALVASIDPDFKAFLASLGWTTADFSTGVSTGASQ